MTKTVAVSASDISLFHVAARLWGDATAWLALAEANGLTDPFLSGPPLTLTVPDYDPSFTGGIPQE